MAVILKCPHCGRMESWRETDGARTHCTFCKQPLSGSVEVSQVAQSHAARPRTSEVLRQTLWGGALGGGLAGLITLLYFGLPAFLAALSLLGNLRDDQRAAAQQLVLSLGMTFLVVAAIGCAVGCVLMSITSAVLQSRPILLRAAGTGAILGSVMPSLGVFVAMTIPLTVIHGFEAAGGPQMYARHWLLSLAAAAGGSVLGLLAGLLIVAVREDGSSRNRSATTR